MTMTETLTVRFEDEQHQNLHRVLFDAGFTFQINADLRVGRLYQHPKKPIKIFLEEVEEERPWLEPKVEYQGQIQTDREYSVAEWNWMTGFPDTPEGAVETLKRELHILINIRPKFLEAKMIATDGAD